MPRRQTSGSPGSLFIDQATTFVQASPLTLVHYPRSDAFYWTWFSVHSGPLVSPYTASYPRTSKWRVWWLLIIPVKNVIGTLIDHGWNVTFTFSKIIRSLLDVSALRRNEMRFHVALSSSSDNAGNQCSQFTPRWIGSTELLFRKWILRMIRRSRNNRSWTFPGYSMSARRVMTATEHQKNYFVASTAWVLDSGRIMNENRTNTTTPWWQLWMTLNDENEWRILALNNDAVPTGYCIFVVFPFFALRILILTTTLLL
jgi:hypothetical protein